jgi:Flp pilus assembly protein TadD
MIGSKKVSLSAEFAKTYNELAKALEANASADVSAQVTAAHAAAKSPEEHYLAYQLQLKAAMGAKNEAEMGKAVAGMLSTGVAPAELQGPLHLANGKVKYNQKQYAEAAAEFQKVLQLDPANAEAKNLLTQTQLNSASPADAVAMLQKSIAEQSAGGAKAPEALYKRALSAAYKAKLPAAVDISRQWVADYPTPANWSDAIRIYRNFHELDDAATLDLLRLARAAGALNGEADYDRYAYAALMKGYPGEAKTVLEEGIKAGVVNPEKSPFKEEIAQAKTKSAGEEASLDSSAKSALAGGTAKAALATGDLHYTYGQYAKAAELYRAALKKSGADANLINLHLGMALARSGDKAGATAALNAVTGPRADIAKYWLAYVSTLS